MLRTTGLCTKRKEVCHRASVQPRLFFKSPLGYSQCPTRCSCCVHSPHAGLFREQQWKLCTWSYYRSFLLKVFGPWLATCYRCPNPSMDMGSVGWGCFGFWFWCWGLNQEQSRLLFCFEPHLQSSIFLKKIFFKGRQILSSRPAYKTEVCVHS